MTLRWTTSSTMKEKNQMKFQNISGKSLAMTGPSEFLPRLRLLKNILGLEKILLVIGDVYSQMCAYLRRMFLALKYKDCLAYFVLKLAFVSTDIKMKVTMH